MFSVLREKNNTPGRQKTRRGGSVKNNRKAAPTAAACSPDNGGSGCDVHLYLFCVCREQAHVSRTEDLTQEHSLRGRQKARNTLRRGSRRGNNTSHRLPHAQRRRGDAPLAAASRRSESVPMQWRVRQGNTATTPSHGRRAVVSRTRMRRTKLRPMWHSHTWPHTHPWTHIARRRHRACWEADRHLLRQAGAIEDGGVELAQMMPSTLSSSRRHGGWWRGARQDDA